MNQQDRDQSTALIQSCLYNNTPLAKLLVERGANVNKADKVSKLLFHKRLHTFINATDTYVRCTY